MKTKTTNRDNIHTMDDVRYSYNWLALAQQFTELDQLTSVSDNAFMMDDRITSTLRSCRIIFLQGEDIVGHVYFRSSYGCDIIEDFISCQKDQIYIK